MKTIFFCILGIFIGCSSNSKDRSENHEADSQSPPTSEQQILPTFISDSLLEVQSFDLDSDAALDTILLLRPSYWPDAGDFHFLRFLLGNGRTQEFTDEGGWDPFASAIDIDSIARRQLKISNLVNSDRIVVLRGAKGASIVLAFGVQYASNTGIHSFFRVDRDSATLVFHDNFYVEQFQDVTKDDIPDFVGVWDYNESWGRDSVWLEYYRPYIIYVMPGFHKASEQFLRSYNQTHYVGYISESAKGPYVVARIGNRRPIILRQEEAKARFGF